MPSDTRKINPLQFHRGWLPLTIHLCDQVVGLEESPEPA